MTRNYPPVTITIQLDENARRAVARYYGLRGVADDGYVLHFCQMTIARRVAELYIKEKGRVAFFPNEPEAAVKGLRQLRRIADAKGRKAKP